MYGVHITANSSNNAIRGNFIGISATGTEPLSNHGGGIGIGVASNNNIVANNVVSANKGAGVTIFEVSNTIVESNIIGLDPTGTIARGNSGNAGIVVAGSVNTRIGTNGDGVNDELERNIISGNGQEGIQIEGSKTTGTIVAGNYIGTNTAGTSAIPNSFSGILVWGGATNSRIGTDGNGAFDAHERNVISGNSGFGVNIGDSSTKNSVVAGNHIGTNAAGTAALPNSYGIYVTKATDIRIGTNGDGVADDLERNVISGNTSAGIYFLTGNPQIYGLTIVDKIFNGDVASSQSTGTIAQADLSDSTNPSNGNWGYNFNIPGGGGDDYFVVVTGTIQVTTAGTYSFSIAGDNGGRLKINNATIINDDSLNVFESRYGQATLSAGTHTFEWIGFEWYGAAGFELSVNSAANNTSAITSANGWKVLGDPSPHSQIRLSPGTNMSVTTYKPAGPEKSNSVIAGNYIGTNAAGNSKVGNGGNGVWVTQSKFVTIGGDTGAERNIISGNNSVGIAAYSASSDLNIEGNFVGLAADGFSAIDNNVGIDFWTSKQSTLKNNVISSNRSYGLWVDRAEDVKITANIIGLSADGLSARPNSSIGLYSPGSKRLQIGTDGDGVNDQLEGNVISANTSANIRFDNTEDSYVAGNIIGLSKQHSLVSSTPATTPGIVISSSTNVRIGTDGSNDAFNESERNVIAGNTGAGIRSIGSTTSIAANRDTANVGIVVAGNWIGVDPSGNRRANQGVGFLVEGNVPGIRLGTNSDGLHDALEANTIAGNTSHGVQIGTTTSYSELSNNAIIAGNFIGVLGDGSTLQGNDGSGIVISAAPNTLIGSNGDGVRDSVERNIISGNKISGIEILGGVNQIYSIGRAQSLVDGTLLSNRVSGTIAQADLFDTKGGVSSSWSINHPIPGGGGDDYAIRMTAEIEVLTAGDFTFATYSDDGSRLKVNGVTIATDETSGGNTLRGSINLPVGTYPIEWLAYERGFNAGFELSVIPGKNVNTTVSAANNWKVLGDVNPHSQIRLKVGTTINVDAYYSTGRQLTNATVRGNIIGTDATGQSSGLGNTLHGISLDGTNTVLIANNLVSGNVGNGINASADSKTTLQGNRIGTNATGTTTLGNQPNGVAFVNGSTEIVIGGPSPQHGNLVAGNSTGIRLDVPASNISQLRHNRFYHNATVALDVGPAGSTPNDEGDVDGVRNAPIITAVRLLNDSLLIEGFARPGTSIDLYKTRSYASGFGQGETYLASVVEGGDKDQDSTTGSYNAGSVGGIAVGSDTTNRFRFVLPWSELQTSITGGEWIAAVAIDPTSEFGNQTIVGREISLSSTSIAENSGINAVVGTLSTADPDATNTFTYTLVSGSGDTDNAAFNIDGSSLRANNSFDFETKSSYSVRVRSTDQGGLWTEKAFTITVTDVIEGVVLNGTTGNDAFVATYSGDGTSHAWSVTRNGTNLFNGPLPIGALIIDGLGGSDALQVVGGALNDVFQLGSNQVSMHGAIIQFSNTETLRLSGGNGNDELTVLAVAAPGITSRSFDGGAGIDTVKAVSGTNTFNVTGAGAANLNGTANLAMTTIESLVGGDGDDQFVYSSAGSLTGKVLGGGGTDTLNLSVRPPHSRSIYN
jgi:parallel beta-helix repeat protein